MDPDELDQRLSALRHAPLPGALSPAADVRARGDRRRRRARVTSSAALVVLVAGAAIASASLVGQDGTTPHDIASPDATLSMSTEPSPSPSAAFTPAPDVTPNGSDFGYIREIRDTPAGVVLVFDRAYLLTGEAARQAKLARGVHPDEPPDYYIQNDESREREILVAPGVEVVGSLELIGAAASEQPSTLQRLREYVTAGGTAPFNLRYDGQARAVRIAEQYLA